MSVRKERLIAALERRAPGDRVPLWELHFHLWSRFSRDTFISGREYLRLGEAERDRALRNDAGIIVDVADRLGFSGVTIPDAPWDCPYTLPPEDRLRLAGYLSAEEPDFIVVAGTGGVLSMPDSSNYVEFCYRLMDAPEDIDEQCRRGFERGVESLKRLAGCGVGAAYVAADMADNRGPFFSPAQMDRFILPYLTKWAEEARKLGVHPILHTDGNVTKLLDSLAATGICAIQALDPVAGMDIRSVKQRTGGRLCLCGNVDCGDLLASSPENIYNDVKRLLLDVKAGGSFVLGASNAVVEATPKENYEALLRAWKECGGYGQ
jgi:uroporphyrinogen decarboxylase